MSLTRFVHLYTESQANIARRIGRASSFHALSLLLLAAVFIVLLVYRTNGGGPQHLLLVVSPNLPYKAVQAFDISTGRYLGTFGNASDPYSVAVGPDNFVYVVDNIPPSTLVSSI